MNTATASGMALRTARAPRSSISRITSSPRASRPSTSSRNVPYRLPPYSTHSSMRPPATASSNSVRPTKWYSRPSCSPGRNARVVADTVGWMPESVARTRAMTVPFPAPEGPEMTKTVGMLTPAMRR